VNVSIQEAPGRSNEEPSDTPVTRRSEMFGLQRVELRLIVGFWSFMALLTAANRLLVPRPPGVQPPHPLAAVSLAFVESFLWAALTPLIFWLSRRFSLERSRGPTSLLLLLGVGLLIAVGVDILDDFLRIEIFGLPRPGQLEFQPLLSLTRFWFLNELIMYFAVLAAGFARDYFLRYRTRREEAMRLHAQTAQLQAQLSEARLSALRTQLNPHFLFNTLHAISTLVERDPAGVRRMIARLGELLRHTLEATHEQEVALEKELELVERYLEILRIRFPGRLEVDTRADPSVLDALVPNLILQPLVENAIEHGVTKIDGRGHVWIRACRDGERVVLSVRDNGPAFKRGGLPVEEGVGLRNTRARLAQLYGGSHSLTLRIVEEGGLEAEIVLPYHTAADLRVAGVADAS
jgi:two-component system LytT family sensor kinase